MSQEMFKFKSYHNVSINEVYVFHLREGILYDVS